MRRDSYRSVGIPSFATTRTKLPALLPQMGKTQHNSPVLDLDFPRHGRDSRHQALTGPAPESRAPDQAPRPARDEVHPWDDPHRRDA